MRPVKGKTILIFVAVALLAVLELGGFAMLAIHLYKGHLANSNTVNPATVMAMSVDAPRSRVYVLYEDSHVAVLDARTGATLMTSRAFISTDLILGDQTAIAVDDRANRVMFAFRDTKLRVIVIDSHRLTLIHETDYNLVTNDLSSALIAVDDQTESALNGVVAEHKIFFSNIRTGRQDGTLPLCSLRDMTVDPHLDRAFVLDDSSNCTSRRTVKYLRAIDLRTRAFIGRKAVPSTVNSLAMDTKDDLLTLVSGSSLQVLRPRDLTTVRTIKIPRPASPGVGYLDTAPLVGASHIFQENGYFEENGCMNNGVVVGVVMVDLRRGIVEKSMPLIVDGSAVDESLHHLLMVFNPNYGEGCSASSKEFFRVIDLRTGRIVKQQTVNATGAWGIQAVAVDVHEHRFFVATITMDENVVYTLDSRTGRIIAPQAS